MKKVSIFNEEEITDIIAEKKIEGKVIKARIVKNMLYYKIKVPYQKKWNISYKGIKMAYSTKRDEDRVEYFFPVKILKKTNQYLILQSIINLDELSLKPLNWLFTAVVKQKGIEVEMQLVNRSYFNYAKYCSLFFENSYKFADGMFVYPYVNGARNIALQYRKRGEYDDYRIKIKERLAVLRFLITFPYLKHKKIWLIFEKYSQMAQDNAYYFFRYCMDNDIEKKMKCKIYYVITKDSPDRKNLSEYKKNVLDFMSIRHIVYALAAKLLISTDAKMHVYPWRRKGSALIPFIRRKKLIFLQHGVTAMKRVDFFYGKGKSGQCDMFIVTSEIEQKIVIENFGYNESSVPITGFARWDVLRDRSGENKTILIMPTWRSWLEDCTQETFHQSKYFKNYQALLMQPEFYDMLERYDLTVKFYLHPKFKEYVGEFISESKRIEVIPFGEKPLNEIMMESRMLVTDYSSVSWDMFYQKKPVIFYQFDLDDYLEAHGSYINMKNGLFGEVTENTSQLLKAICECVENNFSLTTKQKEYYDSFFKYVDDKNCERICKAIQKNFM